ncbi:MAG: hypothetical protein MJE68_28590, partial [Proteobacteria bacterium]|nr:hypothetical protein [Pseudomonadota bacterium]
MRRAPIDFPMPFNRLNGVANGTKTAVTSQSLGNVHLCDRELLGGWVLRWSLCRLEFRSATIGTTL